MKRYLTCLLTIILSGFIMSCTTDDVVGDSTIGDSELVEIPDAAFGEYMLHNQTPGISSEVENNQVKYFLDPLLVLSVSELSLSKTSGNVQTLINAGVETAEDKITDITGIEYFTSLQRLVLTANDVETMDLSALTNLDALEMNFNLVSDLNLSQNTELTRLRYRGSAQANENQKITTIDLSNNTKLRHLYLINHSIVTINLSNNLMIDELLDLSGNPGPDGDTESGDIVVPAAIYNQLAPGDRSGVVPDSD